jgi:hypothetical protein
MFVWKVNVEGMVLYVELFEGTEDPAEEPCTYKGLLVTAVPLVEVA